MIRILDVAVEQVMTLNPATVEAEDSLAEAAGAMVEGGFRHLPVIDGAGRIVGMLSERDLRGRLGVEVERFPAAGREVLEERVEAAMRPDPITVGPGTTLREVIGIFGEERVGAVPVVDERERPIGIVSYLDVLGFLREQDRMPARPRAEPRKAAAKGGRRRAAARS
jgi:CBS domain-containing protein